MLIADGLIVEQELSEALRLQRYAGGTLGTNLLERGSVSEAQLLATLGKRLRSSTVSGMRLRRIPAQVIEKISAEVATLFEVVPFQVHGSSLRVAAIDPRKALEVEERIRTYTPLRVRAYVALEFRIHEALKRYYGQATKARFDALTRRLQPSPVGGEERTWRPARAGPRRLDDSLLTGPVAPRWDDRVLVGADEGSGRGFGASLETRPVEPFPASQSPKTLGEPMSEEETATPTSATASAVGSPATRPATADSTPIGWNTGSLAHLEERARRVTAAVSPTHPLPSQDGKGDAHHVELLAEEPEARLMQAAALLQQQLGKNRVAEVVLDYCRPFLKRRILFLQRRKRIVGWKAAGDGVDQRALQLFWIKSGTPSIFFPLTRGSEFWLGPLPAVESNRSLKALLGGRLPQECVVVPIEVRQQAVAFLYGDNVEDGVGHIPLRELRRLAAKAGLAFELCILRNKLDSA